MVSAAHRGDSRSVRAAAEARLMAWIRAPKLGDDPALHYCVAAYSSDFALLETSLLPHRQTIPAHRFRRRAWTTRCGSTRRFERASGCCT